MIFFIAYPKDPIEIDIYLDLPHVMKIISGKDVVMQLIKSL